MGEYKIVGAHKFEIQVRSILQHAWAEIEHDLGYKNKVELPKDIKRRLSRLAGLLEIANAEFTNIKQDSQDYAEVISKDILNKPEEVPIDSISLPLFVKNNQEIKDLDVAIGGVVKSSQPIYDDQRIGSLTKFLKSVGLNNLEELGNAFKKYKNLILPFSKGWLVDVKNQNMPGGISLFYLCYVMLGSSGSEQKVVDFFIKNNILPNEDIAIKSTKKLMTILNQIVK